MTSIQITAIALIFAFLGGLIMLIACEVQLLDRCELQMKLNWIEPENPLELDCVIGPETIAKWDRVCANQWGILMHERFMR